MTLTPFGRHHFSEHSILTAVLISALLCLTPGLVQAGLLIDFEAPTYTSGALVPQDLWTGGTAPRVQTDSELATELVAAGLNAATTVHNGSQAVIATGTGGTSSTIRPVSGFNSATKVGLDVWARPLSPGASGSSIGANVGNAFMTMEDSAGTRAAAFRFGATLNAGQLATTSIDYYSQGTGWIPSGIAWQPDTWYNIQLVADYSAKTYSVIVDGAMVQPTAVFYNTESADLSQIRIFRGSGQAGMILDSVNLAVVPEPSAIALAFASGSVSLLVRRRRWNQSC